MCSDGKTFTGCAILDQLLHIAGRQLARFELSTRDQTSGQTAKARAFCRFSRPILCVAFRRPHSKPVTLNPTAHLGRDCNCTSICMFGNANKLWPTRNQGIWDPYKLTRDSAINIRGKQGGSNALQGSCGAPDSSRKTDRSGLHASLSSVPKHEAPRFVPIVSLAASGLPPLLTPRPGSQDR